MEQNHIKEQETLSYIEFIRMFFKSFNKFRIIIIEKMFKVSEIKKDLERTYYKMSINEKIKSINNNIGQNKVQYNLGRQTAKISALSSGNVSKYKYLTGKDVLPEKKLLKKAATIKRFEYSLSSKAFEKQTNVIKKHTEVIKKNEEKTNKLLKSIIGTDEKYWDKVENALIYLHKKTGRKIC